MTPARLAHLLTLPVLTEQLAPSYAKAQNRLPDEVYDELRSGMMEARLQAPLMDATWRALQKQRPGLPEAELLEKVAKAMAKAGGGPRPAVASEAAREKMTAFLAMVDVNVGRASETARAALETEQGQKMLARSLDAVGEFLASRLLAAAK